MYQNKVYLASPFSSPEQKERIDIVMAALKKNPTIDPEGIYNPQEHQAEGLEFGSRDGQDTGCATDMRQVKRADEVEGNPEPDAGTIFEVGAAWAWNIPVVMAQFHPDNELNLMLARSHPAMFTGDQMGEGLATYDFNNLPTHWTDMKVF